MLACLRISRAPLTHAYLALRVLSTSAPLSNAAPDEPTEAIRTLADLVQSAADEQGKRSRSAHKSTRKAKTDLLEPGAPPRHLFAPTNPHQFISPHQFTREHRIARIEKRRKDPTLGPSRKHAQAIDAFRKLAIDPLDEFKNPLLLKSFVSEMGKIHSRAKTGLTWRSQRRVGKAIRRARALGFIPLWNSPQVSDGSGRMMLPDWTATRPTKARLR
ncbi:30S ribosomal protein S18 [Rhizoctonia solani AG-3 Rhs1AP]|uniref:Small ribosomal subunit protein bS18m n=1 Tax=Rhizoctonia solani AG-3 Rhs1AP TaxID=1086054 RepID=X8JUH3_9AGAM|nr:30S ribosomal protein S18 [Rhizoctonia solani AG-3 Rhs1AP]